MINGNYNRLDRRNIDEETCKVFDYQQGEYEGKPVQIANYYDKHYNKVAQKIRFQDKTFKWLGDTDKITFFLDGDDAQLPVILGIFGRPASPAPLGPY